MPSLRELVSCRRVEEAGLVGQLAALADLHWRLTENFGCKPDRALGASGHLVAASHSKCGEILDFDSSGDFFRMPKRWKSSIFWAKNECGSIVLSKVPGPRFLLS